MVLVLHVTRNTKLGLHCTVIGFVVKWQNTGAVIPITNASCFARIHYVQNLTKIPYIDSKKKSAKYTTT